MGVVHSSFGTRGKEKNLYLAPSVLNGEENIDFSGCKNVSLSLSHRRPLQMRSLCVYFLLKRKCASFRERVVSCSSEIRDS